MQTFRRECGNVERNEEKYVRLSNGEYKNKWLG
jgi:hypothetical protein